MKNKVICKICGKSFVNTFGTHLKYEHNLSSKEYYDLYIKSNENEGICDREGCNNPTKFRGLKEGYAHYCCRKCIYEDETYIKRQKIIQSKAYKKGLATKKLNRPNDPNNAKKMIETRRKNNTLNSNSEIKNKIKDTYNKKTKEELEQIKQKANETRLKNGTLQGSELMREKARKVWTKEKLKQRYDTELERGTTPGSKSVVEKRNKTCRENGIYEKASKKRMITMKKNGTHPSDKEMKKKNKESQLRQETMEKRIKTLKKNHPEGFSKINKDFEALLKEKGFKYESEFPISPYIYDFYLPDYNILLEINPSITHNITFHPYGDKISKDYHKNKTIKAEENNFICVCIWDWINKEKILDLIKFGKLKIIKREPKQIIFNIKTNKIETKIPKKFNKSVVEIYDDGRDIEAISKDKKIEVFGHEVDTKDIKEFSSKTAAGGKIKGIK